MDDQDHRELKNLLQKHIRVSEENNKILKKMHSSMKWAKFFRFLYWVIIIGTTVGAYYFIQPIIESFADVFRSFSSGIESVGNIGDSLPDMGSLFGGGDVDGLP